MTLSEFDLIETYFSHSTQRDDVILGIGDDAALLQAPNDCQIALTTDTMVEGVHFSPGADPQALGHKLMAVNLSDLAAMGAEPTWATLAATLPEADADWLRAFSRGLLEMAARYRVQLVGGDITRGALTLTVQAAGTTPNGLALTRSGAKPGDLIYVSGTLGDAGMALLVLQGQVADMPTSDRERLAARLHWPEPRVELGLALRGIASAAIDISDGLVADLGHILAASGVGGVLQVERLPISPLVRDHLEAAGGWSLPLSAGDDYELCFTIPPERQPNLEAAIIQTPLPCTWVGTIEAQNGLRCVMGDGSAMMMVSNGYQHF